MERRKYGRHSVESGSDQAQQPEQTGLTQENSGRSLGPRAAKKAAVPKLIAAGYLP